MRTLLLGLLLLPAAPTAQGGPQADFNLSWQILKAWCDDSSVSACATYIQGVVEGTGEAMHELGLPAPFCFAHPEPPAELAFMMRKFLDDHPGDPADEASKVILAAMKEKFPCRGERQL
jgi:hypothetical protein